MTTGLSVYLLLVGLGRLLLPAPETSGPFTAVIIALGVASCRLWWRQVVKPSRTPTTEPPGPYVKT